MEGDVGDIGGKVGYWTVLRMSWLVLVGRMGMEYDVGDIGGKVGNGG